MGSCSSPLSLSPSFSMTVPSSLSEQLASFGALVRVSAPVVTYTSAKAKICVLLQEWPQTLAPEGLDQGEVL